MHALIQIRNIRASMLYNIYVFVHIILTLLLSDVVDNKLFPSSQSVVVQIGRDIRLQDNNQCTSCDLLIIYFCEIDVEPK